MPMSEGSNAYKVSNNAIDEKKRWEEREAGDRHPARRVRSTKTIRLNKLHRPDNPVGSARSMAGAFRSLNAGQLKMVFTAALSFGVLVGFFLVNISYQAKENELSATIAERQQELEVLQHDYEGLKVKYDKRMNPSSIEEYAKEKLGMQKRENFQLEWINVGSEDDFVTEESQKSSWFDRLASYFD